MNDMNDINNIHIISSIHISNINNTNNINSMSNSLPDNSSKMRNSSTNNPTLYLTTQENSYGVVSNRWWNGRAEPFEITGGFRNIQINSIQRSIIIPLLYTY